MLSQKAEGVPVSHVRSKTIAGSARHGRYHLQPLRRCLVRPLLTGCRFFGAWVGMFVWSYSLHRSVSTCLLSEAVEQQESRKSFQDSTGSDTVVSGSLVSGFSAVASTAHVAGKGKPL